MSTAKIVIANATLLNYILIKPDRNCLFDMDRAGLKLYFFDQFTLMIGPSSSQNTRDTWLCYKGITSDPYQTLAKNFFVLFNYFTQYKEAQLLTFPWCRDQISTETVEIECWVQTSFISKFSTSTSTAETIIIIEVTAQLPYKRKYRKQLPVQVLDANLIYQLISYSITGYGNLCNEVAVLFHYFIKA